MPCCQAEKFKWCEMLNSVCTDQEGKKYCVFHAPKGQKGVTVEQFNDLIFERIQEAKQSNGETRKVCNLSGTAFEGPVDFKQFNEKNPLPSMIFVQAVFSAKADFSGASFSEWTDFSQATFSGQADFSGASFSERTNFSRATFSGQADFRKATFSAEGTFTEATFSEPAYFSEATFSAGANFGKASFSAETSFGEASFSKGAYFIRASFSGEANFATATFSEWATFWLATFSEEASFARASFSGQADFTEAMFSEPAYFSEATFSAGANFGEASFSAEAIFAGASFSAEANFWLAKFSQIAYFLETAFNGVAQFERCLADKAIRFEEVDLSSASFLETDLTNWQFVRCKWPQKHGRDLLYNEINADGVKGFEQAEDLYRQLKQKYKQEHNEPEASKWHYGEKEMFRKKRRWRRFNPLSISNLYWGSSGYGERPVRAGLVLLLLVVIVTLLMNFFGLVAPEEGKDVYGVYAIEGFSGRFNLKKCFLLIYNTIQYAAFFKTPLFKPATLAGDFFLGVFTKLLIPVQAALFTLALRNKFRR